MASARTTDPSGNPYRPTHIASRASVNRILVAEALSWLARSPRERPFWAHQGECVKAFADHLGDPGKDARCYAVVPSGGGKTAVFTPMVEAVSTLAATRGAKFRTIVLAPTLPLVAQVLDEFAARHPHLPRSYVASREVTGRDGAAHPRGWGDLVVMTYTGFAHHVAAGDLGPGDVDLLVMDEAHRGLSDLRREVIESLFDDTVVTAFSATPEFDADKNLDALMGRRNRAYAVGPQRLRDEGVIAPVANYVLGVRIEGDMPEDPDESLLLRRKAMVDEVLAFLDVHFDDALGQAMLEKPLMFYGADISHATMFADEFNRAFGARGKRMEAVSGLDAQVHVTTVIDGMRSGEVDGLSSAQLLVEGLDLPRVGTVVNSATSSVVKIVQQSGRAQRMDPDLERDDPGQQAFVLDTYVEVNGRIQGRPRWFFEASEGIVDVHSVSRDPVDAADVDVTGYRASGEAVGNDDLTSPTVPKAGDVAERETRRFRQERAQARDAISGQGSQGRQERGPFVSTHDVEKVRYLVRRRDAQPVDGPLTPEWVSKHDIVSLNADEGVHAFFASMAAEHAQRRLALAGDEPLTRAYQHGDESSDPVSIRMSLRQSGFKQVTCYHEGCVADLVRISGAPMPGHPPSEGWMPAREARDAIGAKWERSNAVLTATYQAFLVQERLQRDPEGVTLMGRLVRMRRIAGGTKSFVAYHADAVGPLRALVGLDLPFAGPDDLNMPAMAERLGLHKSARPLKALWAVLGGCIDRGEPTAFQGTPLEASRRYVEGREQVVVDAGLAPLVARLLDVDAIRRREDRWRLTDDLPHHGEGWLGRDEVFGRLHTTFRPGRPLGVLWRALEGAEERGGERTAGGTTVRMRLMRSLNRAAVFLHADDVEVFRAAARDPDASVPLGEVARAPDRPDGWLTRAMAAPLLSMTIQNADLQALWDAFREDLAAVGRFVDADGREVAVRMMRTRSGGVAPCVHEDEVPWLGRRLGRSPAHMRSTPLRPREEGDLDRLAVARVFRVKPDQPAFAAAWREAKAEVAEGRCPDGLHARLLPVHRSMVLRPEGLEAFAALCGLPLGLAPVPEGHLLKEEVAARLRADLGQLPMQRFDALWQAWTEAENPTAGDHPLRIDLYRRIRQTGHAIHPDDYPRVLAEVRGPKREPQPVDDPPDVGWEGEWILVADVAMALGLSVPNPDLRAALADMAACGRTLPKGVSGQVTAWKDGGAAYDVRRIILPSVGGRPFAMRRADLDRLAARLDIVPQTGDDPDWKPLVDFLPSTRPAEAVDLVAGIERAHLADRKGGNADIDVPAMPAFPPLREEDPDLPEPVGARVRVALRRRYRQSLVYVHASSWRDMGRLTGVDLDSPGGSEGWWTLEDLYADLGITFHQAVDTAFRAVGRRHARRMHLTGVDMPVEVDGKPVRVRRHGGKPLVHPDDVPAILRAATYVRAREGAEPGRPGTRRPDAWVDRRGVANHARVNPEANPVFRPFWDAVAAAFAGGPPVTLDGLPLAVSTRADTVSPCIPREDLDRVVRSLGFVNSDKTGDWLDKTAAAKAAGTHIRQHAFAALWDGLVAGAEAGADATVAAEPIGFERRISGSRTPWCIHRSAIPRVRSAVGLPPEDVVLPGKDEGWMTEAEFCLAHRTNPNTNGQPLVNALWREFEDAVATGREVTLRTGMPRVALVQNRAWKVACIRREDAPMVAGHLGVSPPMDAASIAADWLPRTAVSSAMGADRDEDALLADLWAAACKARLDGDATEFDGTGARVRYDFNGSSLVLRVHREDVDLVADWLRSPSPANGA